jgi:hypothetical protein
MPDVVKNCLAACGCKYSAGAEFGQGQLQKGISGATQAPLARITFRGRGDQQITVGNESMPGHENHAVIKSFEFGNTDGAQCTVEIVDEEGGAFEDFIDNIIKDIKDTDGRYTMEVEFGWIVTFCDGTVAWETNLGDSSGLVKPTNIFLLPLSMEINFANGKVYYKIIGFDAMQSGYVTRANASYGTKANPMPLKEAVKALFKDGAPDMDVKFVSKTDDLKIQENAWEFSGDPKGVWNANTQNKLSSAMNWIAHQKTNNDKGVYPQYDFSQEKPTVLFIEDIDSKKNKVITGTYIVNGGDCSNVLSFTPTINWIMALSKFGVGGGLTPAFGEPVSTYDDFNQTQKTAKEAGIMVANPLPNNMQDMFGSAAGRKSEEGKNLNAQANQRRNIGADVVEAELRIQGDARYANPLLVCGSSCVNIVFVNPFFIKGGVAGECGDWLAQPATNDFLTDDNWRIMGCHHSIREGSFVTTLRVRLEKGNPNNNNLLRI